VRDALKQINYIGRERLSNAQSAARVVVDR
jgi:hypothetical protein